MKRVAVGLAVYLIFGSVFFLLTGWPGTGLTFLILGVLAGWSYPRWGEWWEHRKDWFF